MINSNCDMHTHTNCSDGELSHVQFVNFAHELGVKYLSVTDHDNVDFYLNKEAINLLNKYQIQYITGCEFVCRVGLHPIEILGYGIDVDKAKKYLDKHGVPEEKMRTMRVKESKIIFKKLGFNIDFKDLDQDPVDVIYDEIKSNSKLKDIIEAENPCLLESPSNVLRQGLNNPKSILYINPRKYFPSYKKIIKLIQKKLHGVAIVAHPFHYGYVMEKVLTSCVNANIDGIECYHYTVNSKAKNEYLINYAKRNNLLISGGSDFHNRGDIKNMREQKMIKIPANVFKTIKSKLEKRNAN